MPPSTNAQMCGAAGWIGVVAATPRAMRVYGDGPIARENSIHECRLAEINLFDNLTWSGYRAD